MFTQRVSKSPITLGFIGFSCCMALLLPTSCAREEVFRELGDQVANPSAVEFSPDESHLYVLNADLIREFNQGSLLVFRNDNNGSTEVGPTLTRDQLVKIKAIPTPRLGFSLSIGGPGNRFMLATFTASTPEDESSAWLFDITDPASPNLVASLPLPCDPVNGILQANYEYVAIGCRGGGTVLGRIDAAAPGSLELRLVRQYSLTRRAMVMLPELGVLVAFPTDLFNRGVGDRIYTDNLTYPIDGGPAIEESNDIPDEFERNSTQRSRLGRRRWFQYIVLPLAKAYEEGFKQDVPANANLYTVERRFLYFDPLNAIDGSLLAPEEADAEGGEAEEQSTIRTYRTNFFEAQLDANDTTGRSFYLSQRGINGFGNSNQILRVTVRAETAAEFIGAGSPPKTSETLSFERVYGFPSVPQEDGTLLASVDNLSSNNPQFFAFQTVGGVPRLVVNHFTDTKNYDTEDRRYSLGFRTLTDERRPVVEDGFREIVSGDANNSFYDVAVSGEGLVVSGLLYGNLLAVWNISGDEAANGPAYEEVARGVTLIP